MPPWTVGVLALAGFALWWCFVLWAVAALSGWGTLARHYRAAGPFRGHRRHFCSAKIGWANYSLSLTVGTDPAGLYLAVQFPFRPGHPPLFIPWTEVITAKPVRGIFLTDFELRFAAAPRVAVRLSKALGRKVVADANRALAEPGGDGV